MTSERRSTVRPSRLLPALLLARTTLRADRLRRRVCARYLVLALAAQASGCRDSVMPEKPVEPPVPTTVVLSPARVSLAALSATQQVTAQVLDQEGLVIAGQPMTWTGSDAAIVDVLADGASAVITAVGTGQATVTARVGAVRGNVAVTVEQVPAILEKVGGDGQEAPEWSVLPVSPAVHVLDANRHMIDGSIVEFTVTEGGGRVDPVSVPAVNGQAATSWTLGPEGVQVLLATAGDASAQFSARALEGVDTAVVFVTTDRLPKAYASFDYSAALEARGGQLPYAWDLPEGGLPDGMTLTEGGEIRGPAQWAGLSSFVARATDARGEEATARLDLETCAPPLELDLGEVHVTTPTRPGDCGFSLRAASAGSYWRVTLVGSSAEDSGSPTEPSFLSDSVAVKVRGSIRALAALQVIVADEPVRPDARRRPAQIAREAEPDFHLRIRMADERLLERLAAEGRLRPLPAPSASGKSATAADSPPDTLVIRQGNFESFDDCAIDTSVTTVLQAFSDRLAIYAEPIPDPPMDSANVAVLLRHYERYGAEVIDRWGGVADLDGNGRVIVYLDANLPAGSGGVVSLGDMLSPSECPVSNGGEFVRIERAWVEDRSDALSSVLVHEVQHVSSIYKRLLNSLSDPFSLATQHDIWIEEGRAVMAEEVASRLAWADAGGPAPTETVTSAHISLLFGQTEGLFGVYDALSRTKHVFTDNFSNSIADPPFGGGWQFHRFLVDWYGGAGREPPGDAELMHRLIATNTPAGVAGIEQVTSRSLAELMSEYAVAISLAGTGAPELPGVPRFATYDFTGLGYGTELYCCREVPGRFPWPVTMQGRGADAELWSRLGISATLEGELGYAGIRVHDFRASASDEAAVFEVGAPDDVGVIVVRIPDQSRPGG